MAAKCFAENGDRVLIVGRNAEKCAAAAEKLPGCCAGLRWDVADAEHARDYLAQAVRVFGRIDTVVNCAGLLSEADRVNDFFAVTPDAWRDVEAVNMRGTFFVCQAFAEYMIREGIRGHIVNVCSEMGFRPVWYPYGATKWGVRGITYGLGKLLTHYGIVVNGIAPGHTATEMVAWHEGDSLEVAEIPRGVMARPEEIADSIVYLSSDAARNIIGHILISDGGRHLT